MASLSFQQLPTAPTNRCSSNEQNDRCSNDINDPTGSWLPGHHSSKHLWHMLNQLFSELN